MPIIRNIILSAFLLVIFSLAAMSAVKRPTTIWNYFHFDGHNFVPGEPAGGSAFIAVKRGHRPVVLRHTAAPEAFQMPSGHGALAGFCYIQSSGGKLARTKPYHPASGVTVQISSDGKIVAVTETDENGYFITVLPAGKYLISCRISVEAIVEKGSTKLIPLRVGKRMVD